MLFQPDELQRHRVEKRGGLQGGVARKRFGPIKHGKFTLVRVELDRDKRTGEPKIHKGPKVSSISFRCVIAEGQQEGRWFFDRFVLSGFMPGKERTRECLAMMLSCYDRDPRQLRVGLVDQKVFPVMVLQKPHWQTGRIENEIHALGPNPEHPDHDGYHDVVKRCMQLDDRGKFRAEVPGWELYPESKSYKLVQKRLRDAQERMPVTGLTRLEARRQRTSARAMDRFFQEAA